MLCHGNDLRVRIVLLGLAIVANGWSLKGRYDEIHLGLDSVGTGGKEAVTKELTGQYFEVLLGDRRE